MNQAALAYCYATALDELNQLWISYLLGQPDPAGRGAGAQLRGKILLPLQTCPTWSPAIFRRASDLTWDQIEETWDELERAWDDRTMQAGYSDHPGGRPSGLHLEAEPGRQRQRRRH